MKTICTVCKTVSYTMRDGNACHNDGCCGIMRECNNEK